MKTTLLTITAFALILVPCAWATARAHETADHSGMQGMHMKNMHTLDWGHPGEANTVDRTIHIKAKDSMRFVPDKLTVKAGNTIKFVLTNVGKLEHEFVLGTKSEQKKHEKEMREMVQSGEMHMEHADPNEIELDPGATRTLIWTFTKPGTYQYACHEPGHHAAGMIGIITVEKSVEPTQPR